MLPDEPNLSVLKALPPVTSCNGYSWKAGQSKQVVFLTGDGHIHELSVTPGNPWIHLDVTLETPGTPYARLLVNGYSWEAGQSKQVVFLTGDGHIHELYVILGEPWRHADLTAMTGAPPTPGGTLGATQDMNGYSWEAGRSKQVVFAGNDGHIYELWVALGGEWHSADLTAISGAPTWLS